MVINGVELQFDIWDAENAAAFEAANRNVEIEAERLKNLEGVGLAEVIKEQCYTIFDFFDTVFGEGVDQEIFEGRTNLRDCLKAYREVVEEAGRQKDELIGLFPQESAPVPVNREQRRNKRYK